MFIEIGEKLLVLIHAFARAFVGNAGRFDDAEIRPEMVDIADISFSEDGNGVAGFHKKTREQG
jgi:hypothetical protein